MSAQLYRLGSFCARRGWVVVGAWALILLIVSGSVLQFGAQTSNDIRLPGTGSQAASDVLAKEFPPQQNGASPIVYHVTTGNLNDAVNKAAVEAALARVKHQPHVYSVLSPYTKGIKNMMSADGKTAIAQVLLDVNGLELTTALANDILKAAQPPSALHIQVEAGGAIGNRISQDTSHQSEKIGLIAALIILAFTFGALVAAGMPIISALVGLVVGLGLVGLLGHLVNIPTVAPTLATMIGLGVGIDYALFIVFKHRDQLHHGMQVKESIAEAIAISGTAVVFAGGTVIVALLALLVARVPILGAMGYASAIAVLVAMGSAITLVPALLGLVGPRIDALRIPWIGRKSTDNSPDSIWGRWAGVVTRHPWVSLLTALLVLIPLILPTLSLRLGQEDVGVTSTSTTQRRAYDLISQGLGPGATGPLLVAIEFRPPAKPSAAYESAYNEARRLNDEITRQQRALKAQEAALKMRQSELEAAKKKLTEQEAALKQGQRVLLAQKQALTNAEAKLAIQRQQLLADEGALKAQEQALTAKGTALTSQIAAVEQELATLTDPAAIAKLQLQLAQLRLQGKALQQQAAQLKQDKAALQAQGAALAKRGATLKAKGAALTARGNKLEAEAATLRRQATSLTAQAAELKKKEADLKKQSDDLHTQAKKAEALKAQLTDLLTQAGGKSLATDPRLVQIQDAITATPGVASVSPPNINSSGTAAVLAVTATTRPADPKTAELVTTLRTSVIPSVSNGVTTSVYVGGATAAYVDLAALITARLPLVIATVLALSFLLLLLAFRSVFVPLQAVLCNLLAVGAAFGVLTAWFQWGWGLGLVGLSNPYGTVPIASYVPLLMFAVLFGLSMDYEVFLVSQIFNAHGRGEEPLTAIRTGVSSTAKVITAAALIMVSVFASFVLQGDPVIKQFGVGLSIAIVLDATIVRIVIVPAGMAVLGKLNWYLPSWLQWLPRVDLPEQAEGATPESVVPELVV